MASPRARDSVGICFYDSPRVFSLLCSCSPQTEAMFTALEDAMWCRQRFGTVWSQCEWGVSAKVADSKLRWLSRTGLHKPVMSFSKITVRECTPLFNKTQHQVLTVGAQDAPLGLPCILGTFQHHCVVSTQTVAPLGDTISQPPTEPNSIQQCGMKQRENTLSS